MKQNVKETEIGVLEKMEKPSTKQEILSDAAFMAWSFSSDFDFACKYGQITTAACKYYCPLVVNPTIINCCNELHPKFDRVP